jgi:cell wall-associated NlpC family hydrolase
MARKMNIPARALAGYALAELRIRRDIPDCHLSWVTLAGIGATGSNHGRVDGLHLLNDGVMSSPLETLPLRGADGKTVDNRTTIGPMQLPIGLWNEWQRSENGKPNPQDIDDAALTTATALCADGRDTATGSGWWAAIKSIRDSDLFLQRVLANANVYGTIATTKQPIDDRVLTAIRWAISQIGLPYVWGGNGLQSGDAGFDCSGLTKYSYQSAGIVLPRTAQTQYLATQRVPPNEEPRLGDLVFYGSSRGIHHVGMYIGNGQMINAPTFGMAVQLASYRTPGDDFAGAGRPVP